MGGCVASGASRESLAVACGGGGGGRGWDGTSTDRATAVPALGWRWRYGWARALLRGSLFIGGLGEEAL